MTEYFKSKWALRAIVLTASPAVSAIVQLPLSTQTHEQRSAHISLGTFIHLADAFIQSDL